MTDMKPQVYKDERPAEYFDRFHARARRGVGWTYALVRILVTPPALLLYRTRAIGLKNVPRSGALILAPNHFSQMDHFFAGLYLRRKVRFMAKSQMFGTPVLTYVYSHGGVFPVRRGYRDEEAFITAHTILGRGDIVLMYPEGGRSRSGELGEPKRGLGRLALESGAPVVPTAIVGTQKARNWKRLNFPQVTVLYGDPVRFEKIEDPTPEQQQEAAELVFERVKALYNGLREGGRKTALERARAAGRAAHQAADAATRVTVPE